MNVGITRYLREASKMKERTKANKKQNRGIRIKETEEKIISTEKYKGILYINQLLDYMKK